MLSEQIYPFLGSWGIFGFFFLNKKAGNVEGQEKE